MDSTTKQKTGLVSPLISFERVSRFFNPSRAAVFDISFQVYPGEFVYIAGTSGAGKSTLLKLAYCAESTDTGTLRFLGIDTKCLKPKAISILRRDMGIIFQDHRLVRELSVYANLVMPLELRGMPAALRRHRVEEILTLVGLAGRGTELAGSLSGGEQQRTAVARALIHKPALILADEPTASLDAYNADFVLDLLEQAAASGTTVLFATHDRMLMAARPHRTLALRAGRIMTGTGDEPYRLSSNEENKTATVIQKAG